MQRLDSSLKRLKSDTSANLDLGKRERQSGGAGWGMRGWCGERYLGSNGERGGNTETILFRILESWQLDRYKAVRVWGIETVRRVEWTDWDMEMEGAWTWLAVGEGTIQARDSELLCSRKHRWTTNWVVMSFRIAPRRCRRLDLMMPVTTARGLENPKWLSLILALNYFRMRCIHTHRALYYF